MTLDNGTGADRMPHDGDTAPEILLELRNVRTHFHTDRGIVQAVDGVDLVIPRDRLLGVVGESGCGKSVMALTIMGLLTSPPARVSGEILYHGRDGRILDLARLDPKGREFRAIRGAEIAMIFQEPMTSLNPVFTIGDQIIEVIRLHQKVSLREARSRAIEMLQLVGIPAPERRIDDYPRQLSGGMRQRAMIAMAMSCNPALLIADEPTTALDVTIQAQIVELMARLQEEMHTSIVMITHDLGVVAGMADQIAVMYLGQVVEYGAVRSVFRRRHHPYTRGLFHSIPVLGAQRKKRLEPIAGVVPDPRLMPAGCRFADRCPRRMPVCARAPAMLEAEPGHLARCWLHDPQEMGRA